MLQLEKLETLLLKNWTSFIELKPFTAYILSLVSKAEFHTVTSDNNYSGIQIKLSRFYWDDGGFVVWVSFVVPKHDGHAVGTCELFFNGDFQVKEIAGVLVRKT